MTEPSAWARTFAEQHLSRCTKLKEHPPYVCGICTQLALDAAWRAGAEAMMGRGIELLHGRHYDDAAILLAHMPLPAPGEER